LESRRRASVCQHLSICHPEAFLGLIWNSESSNARRRFSGVVSDHIHKLVYTKLVSNVGVGTIVVLLPVGLLASCHIASRVFSWLGLLFCVGVATRGFTTRRDARRRCARVVSCFMFATGFILTRRRDDWRRFSGVVSDRIPRLVYARYFLCRRRDAPRRFARFVPYLFPRLFLALFWCYESVSRRSASVCQPCVLWVLCLPKLRFASNGCIFFPPSYCK
jgi:hypothetical protein